MHTSMGATSDNVEIYIDVEGSLSSNRSVTYEVAQGYS